jgi:predicted metal-dependent phosphoesterase TrpH
LDANPDGAALDRTSRSFADLHCHSTASFDSLNTPGTLVKTARRFGLTHLAITDHERIDGALRARDLAAAETDESPLTIIVGEEVRTADGDMLGLFLERAVPPGLSATETAAAIHAQGGLVGLPHPFDRFRGSSGKMAAAESLAELVREVDFIEAHNARAVGGANAQAAELAVANGLPRVASSDAHSPMEVGVAYTVLNGAFSTADELRALLPSADIVTGRASYYVRLLTPFAKVVNGLRGNRRIRPVPVAVGTEPS